MSNTHEFKIIEGKKLDEFTNQVNEHLKNGWRLYGDLKIFPEIKMFDSKVIHYAQALTKTTNEEQRGFVV